MPTVGSYFRKFVYMKCSPLLFSLQSLDPITHKAINVTPCCNQNILYTQEGNSYKVSYCLLRNLYNELT